MLLASAAVILGIVGVNFVSLSTLLLLVTGGGFALAAHVSEQRAGKLQFASVGCLIGGSIIFFAGVSVLAQDVLEWIVTDRWAPIALGQLWYKLNRSSLNLVQAVVQRYIHPFLWDPIIVSILLCWAFAVLMVFGALLLIVFRRRSPRRS